MRYCFRFCHLYWPAPKRGQIGIQMYKVDIFYFTCKFSSSSKRKIHLSLQTQASEKTLLFLVQLCTLGENSPGHYVNLNLFFSGKSYGFSSFNTFYFSSIKLNDSLGKGYDNQNQHFLNAYVPGTVVNTLCAWILTITHKLALLSLFCEGANCCLGRWNKREARLVFKSSHLTLEPEVPINIFY